MSPEEITELKQRIIELREDAIARTTARSLIPPEVGPALKDSLLECAEQAEALGWIEDARELRGLAEQVGARIEKWGS